MLSAYVPGGWTSRPEDALANIPATPGPPPEFYSRLFLRFLRFGLLAWGGPVAQIDMIRHELVECERWVTHDRFLRTLAVYQVLPGPEAHELCVYFGLLSRGRLGGVLAGLGFMLPGFLLMLLLSWLYAGQGIDQGSMAAAFAGVQPAVVALIVRAIGRIGSRALTTAWLGLLAALGRRHRADRGHHAGFGAQRAHLACFTRYLRRCTPCAYTVARRIRCCRGDARGCASRMARGGLAG